MARNLRKAPMETDRAPSSEPSQDGVKLKETAETPTVAYDGKVWTNTKTDIIQITEDKVQIALEAFARKLSRDGLAAPLGIELSLIALLVTSDFKSNSLGLTADTWNAIFIAITILVTVWFLAALFREAFEEVGRRHSRPA